MEVQAGQSRETAIPALLEAHGGQLFGLGMKLCGTRSDAEDLVQETFLQAYRKWHQFEGRSSPVSWLYAIASRACQRMHRKRSGEPEKMRSLEDLLPFGEPSMAVVPGGEQALLRKEAREHLEAVIASLPLSFRMPLVLKEIVGLSVEEVATVLGLKVATVKTRLHRARLRARQGVEKALPRRVLPPPAYSKQVCLDLLRAKQEALDRGVAFPVADEVVCERCQAVFSSLDLVQDVCREMGQGHLPAELREALLDLITGETGS